MKKEKKYFYFGEKVDGFTKPVLNEREIRASAGLLFFFSMIVFFNGFILGNFLPLKLFVIVFLLDFSIRLFINPKYSPTIIIARFIVNNQTPEYVSASPKRFAWILGFIMALIMFYLSIISNIGFTPLTCILCIICLILLFFESAFGICIGCYIYNSFNKDKDIICAGDICKIKQKEEIQKISSIQVLIVIIFILFLIFFSIKIFIETQNAKVSSITENSSNSFLNPNDCFLNKNNNANNDISNGSNSNLSLILNTNNQNKNIFGGDCIFN